MGQEQGAGSVRMVDKRGAILLIVLIVILTISLLGASMTALFFNVLTAGQVELDRTRSLYLAEAGIAQAVNMLKMQAAGGAKTIEQIIPPTALGGGTFEVYNDFSQSTIVSIGTSNRIRRTIQLKYAAF